VSVASLCWLTALWLGNRDHVQRAGEMSELLMRVYRASPVVGACS
jgi:hypothetical protein